MIEFDPPLDPDNKKWAKVYLDVLRCNLTAAKGAPASDAGFVAYLEREIEAYAALLDSDGRAAA